MDIAKFIEELKGMTLLEINELVSAIENEFGVSAVAAVAVAAPAAAEAAEEKTEFDVILVDAGAEKLKVVKVVKEITGLGLKEAKELVDGAPKPIKEAAAKDECERIVAKIAEVGGKAEIK